MIPFHPSSPFPLLEPGSYTYADAQEHASIVDAWLGLNVQKVEVALMEAGCRLKAREVSREHQQLWIGLAAQSLLTPYTEIRGVLSRLVPKPGATIVDLGAAYGRMGFVVGRMFPSVKFVGYEYVGERVLEARRCLVKQGFNNVRMEHADLTATGFSPVVADFYFIYDYGTPKAIEKTLHDLRRISRSRPITVIARGKACHAAIETRHLWLAREREPERETKSTIFRSVADIGYELVG